MTIIGVDKICKKKILIYIVAASFVVVLLVAALVLVFEINWTKHDDFEKWSYNDQDSWPGFCKSKLAKIQSPIPLNQRFSYKQKIAPIKLENFQICDCLNVRNNGHTVSIMPSNLCNCKRPKLSGGGLTQNYTLENFHFHWPAEHTIDGLSYNLEAHFLFFADKYGTFANAITHPFGITVVAILFHETNYTASNNFRIIADAAKAVSSKPGLSTLTAKPINFRDFLPFDHEIFFTYDGSLTSPDCIEFVKWIVFKNHSNISLLDLKDLTHIYDKNHELIVANHRKLQDINGRRINIQSTET